MICWLFAKPNRNFEPSGADTNRAPKNRTLCRQRGGFDIFNASSSPCDTGFDFFGSRIGGFRISGGHCGWAKNLKISVVEKNRFPRQTLKPKFSIFRRRRPDALLTDRGHGGFAFFAHRHCPATQGSTFSARSARRVREKARGAGRSARGFEFSGWRGDQSKKSKNFWARKNRFPRKTFKSKNSFFRRRRPNAFLTDRGHGGFEFFAHRPCPATQGSTFSARSVRRVQEKSTWSWPRHRRVRNFGH